MKILLTIFEVVIKKIISRVEDRKDREIDKDRVNRIIDLMESLLSTLRRVVREA